MKTGFEGWVLAIVFSAALNCAVSNSDVWGADERQRVYFGTYAEGPQEGIFLADFDPATGVASQPRLAAAVVNPSFLALHPNRKFLYAVSEVSTLEGKKTGGVTAFAVDPATGGLTRLNGQPSEGAGPCHLIVDKAGKNVLVANYDGGTVSVLPIAADGRLKPASSTIVHHGKGSDPERQEAPHAHSINLDAANRYAIAADLGLDRVLVYRFDSDKGTLTANNPAGAQVRPRSGPRHFAFHPSGRIAYVINELANTIIVFWYDPDAGTLSEVQSISTLPPNFKKPSYTAEVVVHPSGKFVYGSNRGHDSLATFEVEPATGRLTAKGQEPTQGKNPRNFAIDPTGAYLFAANQDSDSVVIFRIDSSTGQLKPTGQSLKVHKPVCVRFN